MGLTERREREKEQRRSQIMEAAKRVFYAEGFNGATVELIAQQAELSPATLYLYFKNKSDLYASLNLSMLEFLCQSLSGVAADDGLTPGGKVRAMAGALQAVHDRDPLILFNVFHLQSSQYQESFSQQTLEKIHELSAKALHTMARIFQEGMDDGSFLAREPIALADMVWGVFSGLVLWEEAKRASSPEKNFLAPTLRLALETIARGVEKNPLGDKTA